jgi:hypothetical protein
LGPVYPSPCGSFQNHDAMYSRLLVVAPTLAGHDTARLVAEFGPLDSRLAGPITV